MTKPKWEDAFENPLQDGNVGKWTAAELDLIRNSREELSRLKNELLWGTYGPQGDQSLEKRKLCDLDTDHLENILITQRQIPVIYSFVILEILKERYFQQYRKIG